MDSFAITGRFTLEDWRAYQQACARRLQSADTARSYALQLLALALVGIVAAFTTTLLGFALQLPSFVAGALLVVLLLWVAQRASLQQSIPHPQGAFLAERSCRFCEQGIGCEQAGTNVFVAWSRIEALTASADHLFLWMDRFQAVIVPLRFLAAGIPRDAARERLQGWIDAQRASAAPVAGARLERGDSHLPGNGDIPPFEALGRRLASMGRSALALPERPTIIALALLSFAVWAGVDWLENQPEPSFDPYGLKDIAWYVLAVLSISALIARCCEPKLAFKRATVLVLAPAPAAIAWACFMEDGVSIPWLAVAALVTVAGFVVYFWRGLRAMTGNPQPRAVAVALVAAIAFGISDMLLYVQPSVWTSQEVDDWSSHYEQTWDRAEALMFAQPARIDSQLASITAGEEATPEAFFLGFAGYGEQRVFAQEIKLAAATAAERFGTGGRALLLLNDRRDVEREPLASVTSLRYALAGLAAKMNLEEDVLFLSLSSHGSQEHALSVSNGALPLSDLRAEELASMLKQTGIKWRVIVISACYSGGFIAALRDAYTIVIASAARDRTSFGCSDERDLTYFGEAFYRDALPGARSLRDAFQRSRAAIASREARERVEPSDPQAYFGAQIERRLEALYADLDAAALNRTTAAAGL